MIFEFTMHSNATECSCVEWRLQLAEWKNTERLFRKKILFRISIEKKKPLYVYDGNMITLHGSYSQLWAVVNVMSCVLNTNSSRSQIRALSHVAGLAHVHSG